MRKLLPAWILPHLELYRPALLALAQQVRALTIELEKAAPAALPTGMGALSSVVISREICNWQRFKNRRQVSSYTGLCPGEYSSGTKRVPGSVTKHGNRRLRAVLVELAWRMVRFQPDITRCRTGSPSWQKEPELPGRNARRPSLPSLVSSLWTSGGFIPGAVYPRSSDSSKSKGGLLRSSHKHNPLERGTYSQPNMSPATGARRL
jgi:hypothetical protein